MSGSRSSSARTPSRTIVESSESRTLMRSPAMGEVHSLARSASRWRASRSSGMLAYPSIRPRTAASASGRLRLGLLDLGLPAAQELDLELLDAGAVGLDHLEANAVPDDLVTSFRRTAELA